MSRPIAFLFLGETLLIPHLWPIVEAMAAITPDQPIDCWIATSVHEALLGRWSKDLADVRLRRAPGFRHIANADNGHNPELPPKLPMLARLAPRLIGARAVVCAEQTSLWIPTLLPFLSVPFIKTSHGVGSMSARDDRRRRAARLMLVPSELERQTYLDRGFDPSRVQATGYVKAEFRHRTPARDLFAERRPVVVYAPHWQSHRSSWWQWGRQIVAWAARQGQFNVILSPHQRLVETEPGVREALAAVAALPHIHADTGSFAMVDGSYTAASDIYLGDTSSQVIEFLSRPRPCVFLNAQGIDWRATDDHDFWECGEVIDRLEALEAVLVRSSEQHRRFVDRQVVLAAAAFGEAGRNAAIDCARQILKIAFSATV